MSVGSVFSLLFWLIVVIALADPPGWLLVGGAALAFLAGVATGFLSSTDGRSDGKGGDA